jgi:hypothetical protein
MKKVISILLLAIMLLQVLPIAQWATDKVSMQLLTIDEEKEKDQCDKGKGGKEEVKALPAPMRSITTLRVKGLRFLLFHYIIPPSPPLDLLVPPPDACA